MGYWWFWGYKTFTGPRPNLRHREETTVSDTGEVQEKLGE